MTAYDNSNTGVLFPNERKTSANHPDFTGNVVLSRELIIFATREISEGREPKISVSGWKKTSNAGKGFVSLKISEPWDANKQPARPAQPARQAPSAFDDNDPPF